MCRGYKSLGFKIVPFRKSKKKAHYSMTNSCHIHTTNTEKESEKKHSSSLEVQSKT